MYEILASADAAVPWWIWRAVITVALLTALCGSMGVHVVNFRMAFFSDAISHSAFTGVVMGFMLVPLLAPSPRNAADLREWIPSLTLVVFGSLVGLGVMAVKRMTDLSADTVIGVFFAFVVALGIALISVYGLKANFERYLYGSVVSVTWAEVGVTAALAFVVAVFHWFTFNHLTLTGLNESLARSRGVRVTLLTNLYAVLLSVVVTLSIRTVGLLLVTAMLVVPAAAARNIARGAAGMFWWSIAIGLFSGIIGLWLSFLKDASPGAMIILTASLVFFATVASAGAAARRGG